MGCSASRANNFVTKDQPCSSLSSSSSHSQCPYSNSSSTPLSRTLSLPSSLVHHPPICKGDSTHLVSLTSSTYGSLSLIDPKDPIFMDQESLTSITHPSKLAKIRDNSPLSPHSVINTWELMEGLDEFSFDFVDAPFECPENELIESYEIVAYNDSKPLWQHLSVESLLSNMDPNVDSSYRKALSSKRFERSETKDVVKKGFGYSELDSRSKKEIADMESNRMKEFGCKELNERMESNRMKEFGCNDLNEMMESNRMKEFGCKELNERMESNRMKEFGCNDLNKRIESNRMKQFGCKELDERMESNRMKEFGCKELHERMESNRMKEFGFNELQGMMESNRIKEFGCKELHERNFDKWNIEFSVSGKDDKIVLYYTSVRGIRKTYQDCCEIRMIFRDYRVFVDERDTSMEPSYRKELQDMLKGKAMSLPQVFVRGEYIGGADQIRLHHETGYLVELLKGFPIVDLTFACERCGDARFVLCLTCNGSSKVFEENEEKVRCLKCNENGLIRCPSC